jgi:hypothetical protein
MKITIECDNELDYAIQLHLEENISVQKFVKAAIKFYTALFKLERNGKHLIGFGAKERFKTYNTEFSPKEFLDGEIIIDEHYFKN